MVSNYDRNYLELFSIGIRSDFLDKLLQLVRDLVVMLTCLKLTLDLYSAIAFSFKIIQVVFVCYNYDEQNVVRITIVLFFLDNLGWPTELLITAVLHTSKIWCF